MNYDDSGLEVTRLADLLTRERPERDMLIPPYVPTGLYVMEGESPEVKTRVLMDMALHVATGRSLLSDMACEKRAVAFFTRGMDAVGFAGRISMFDIPDPDNIPIDHIRWTKDSQPGNFNLGVNPYPTGSMFILDRAEEWEVNPPKNSDAGFFFTLGNLADKNSVIISPVGKFDRTMFTEMGAGFITLRSSGDYQTVTFSSPKTPDQAFYYDGRWQPAPAEDLTVDIIELHDVLQRLGRDASVSEIATALGVPNDARLNKKLQRAAARGQIRKTRHGHYACKLDSRRLSLGPTTSGSSED